MKLDGSPYVIVGVMGPQMAEARFCADMDALRLDGGRGGGSGRTSLSCDWKLKPGVSVAQAQAEMNTISHRLEQCIRRTTRDGARR